MASISQTAATATATATTTTTSKSTVMKCYDCNAQFTNYELGNCASGNESLTQSTSRNRKGDEKKDCWWWCRDCMATICSISFLDADKFE
uniref:Secreted protein n=1 Tax=Elaeophora elaphi TaxID=1147741 RepID=A0A0R3S3X1_9BILA